MTFCKSLVWRFTPLVKISFLGERDQALRVMDILAEPGKAIGIACAEPRRHTAIRSVKRIVTAPDVRSAGIAAPVGPASRARPSCGADPRGQITKHVATVRILLMALCGGDQNGWIFEDFITFKNQQNLCPAGQTS